MMNTKPLEEWCRCTVDRHGHDLSAPTFSSHPKTNQTTQHFFQGINKQSPPRAPLAHMAAQISVSLAISWTPAKAPKKTTDIGPMHRVVCPFTPQL